MERGVLVLLVICAAALAMVPRERRSASDGESEAPKARPICESRTPCAWAVYKPTVKSLVELNLTNTYCDCGPGTSCQYDEDDTAISAYVHRCLPQDGAES